MRTLALRNVTCACQTQYQKVDALTGVSRRSDTELLHTVTGRSGSGKTTLLLPGQGFTEAVSALGRCITFSRILFPAFS